MTLARGLLMLCCVWLCSCSSRENPIKPWRLDAKTELALAVAQGDFIRAHARLNLLTGRYQEYNIEFYQQGTILLVHFIQPVGGVGGDAHYEVSLEDFRIVHSIFGGEPEAP